MAEEHNEIKINYTTLFELLVRERTRGELQKLPDSFLEDVSNYIKEKEQSLKGNSSEPKLKAEISKIKKETANIKKIVGDLYSKREKKILNLALDKSRTKSSIVDSQSFLRQEKEFFDELVNLLDSSREKVVESLDFGSENQKKSLEEFHKPEENNKLDLNLQKETKEAVGTAAKEDISDGPITIEPKKNHSEEKTTKLIRFSNAVPKFIGLEGEEYGPFDEEDVASLPSPIADLLIKKERAEEMEEN